MKRLYFDIETSPNVGLFWRPGYQIDVGYQSIVKERAIICICYKWAKERKVHALMWDKDQCDKQMLEVFVSVLSDADEIVAHNGDRFDLPWVRTRCIKHNISMMPNYVSIDTLKAAKKFNFNSNSLDYISQFLGIGTKDKMVYDDWKVLTMDNCKRTLKKMVKYCKQDVVLLENVMDRLENHIPARTSVAERANQCPKCGSSKTTINKHRVTAAGYKKVTFQCQECGKYHTIASSRYEKAAS